MDLGKVRAIISLHILQIFQVFAVFEGVDRLKR